MQGLESNLAPKVQKGVKPPIGMPERVRIILDDSDGLSSNGVCPTGQYFGVNGVGYLLRPGEEVEVPQAIIDILDHAVITVPIVHPQTKQPIGWRDRPRYSYRRVPL